jgi:hypothetical protein
MNASQAASRSSGGSLDPSPLRFRKAGLAGGDHLYLDHDTPASPVFVEELPPVLASLA